MNKEASDIWIACRDCGQRVTGDSIHTCSPQLKPLSEDEIKKLMEVLPTIINTLTDDDLIQFARAIEERHGIK